MLEQASSVHYIFSTRLLPWSRLPSVGCGRLDCWWIPRVRGRQHTRFSDAFAVLGAVRVFTCFLVLPALSLFLLGGNVMSGRKDPPCASIATYTTATTTTHSTAATTSSNSAASNSETSKVISTSTTSAVISINSSSNTSNKRKREDDVPVKAGESPS